MCVKNAEKNPRPSGDLIPHNMQSRHAPREPQQLSLVCYTAKNVRIYTAKIVFQYYLF